MDQASRTLSSYRFYDITKSVGLTEANQGLQGGFQDHEEALANGVLTIFRIFKFEVQWGGQTIVERIDKIVRDLLGSFDEIKRCYTPVVKFLEVSEVFVSETSRSAEDPGLRDLIEKAIKEKIEMFQHNGHLWEWKALRKFAAFPVWRSLIKLQPTFKQEEEGLVDKFERVVKENREILLWRSPSPSNTYAGELLSELLRKIESSRDTVKKSIISGRFDKKELGMTNSLLLGDEGGLYVLLNSNDMIERLALEQSNIGPEYRSFLMDQSRKKFLIGEGSYGKVRFGLCLFDTYYTDIGDLVCIKKSKRIANISLCDITETSLDDYFCRKAANIVHALLPLDMAVCFHGVEESHQKGYVIMEFLPKNNAKDVFAKPEFLLWEHQKACLSQILSHCSTLLKENFFYADLKPNNVLYDFQARRAVLVDIGSCVRVKEAEKWRFLRIPQCQITKRYAAPEVIRAKEGSNEPIDINKALAFSWGKTAEYITRQSDLDEVNGERLAKLIQSMLEGDSNKRTSLEEAKASLRDIGADKKSQSDEQRYYIRRIKDLVNEKKNDFGDFYEDLNDFCELLTTDSNPVFLLDQKCVKLSERLKQNRDSDVLFILGEAGTGKSFALQRQFLMALSEWSPGMPLPFYMSLAGKFDASCMVGQYNKRNGVNINEKEMKVEYFLDSLDENQDESIFSNVLLQHIEGTGSKLRISCRSDYFSELVISPKVKLSAFYIVPFNYLMEGKSEISLCLSEYLSRLEIKADKSKDLVRFLTRQPSTALILKFLLKNFKELETFNKVNQHELYTLAFEGLKVAELQKYDKERQDKIREFTVRCFGLRAKDFADAVDLFGEVITLELYNRKTSRIGSECLDDALGVEFDRISGRRFRDRVLQKIFQLLPIKVVENSQVRGKESFLVGFQHETVKNYYLFKSLLRHSAEKLQSAHDILKYAGLLKNIDLLKYLAEAIDKCIQDNLFQVVLKSRRDMSSEAAVAASNAITLLVASKYRFSNKNLSGIRIPFAILNGGIFEGADFTEAYLKKVSFVNCFLDGAKFIRTNLENVDFGILPDIKGHAGQVLKLIFSPDGSKFASSSSDRALRVWDASTHEKIHEFQDNCGLPITFSPDGSKIAGAWGNDVLIWNLKKLYYEEKLSGHSLEINSLAFSRSGEYLASGSSDSKIFLWRISAKGGSFGPASIIDPPKASKVTAVAFSAHDKNPILATAIDKISLILWDVKEKTMRNKLPTPDETIYEIAFHPLKDDVLACCSSNNTIKIWDFKATDFCDSPKRRAQKENVRHLTAHRDAVLGINYSPDGTKLASCSKDKSIIIWDVHSGAVINGLTGHRDAVNSVCFSKNGNSLFSGSRDGSIKAWNTRSPLTFQKLEGHSKKISGVEFGGAGESTLLMTSSYDGTARLWDVRRGRLIRIFSVFKSESREKESHPLVVLSRSGKYIALAKHAKLCLYAHPSWEERVVGSGFDVITELLFTEADLLFICDKRQTLFLFSVEKNEIISKTEKFSMTQLRVSLDGAWIAGSRRGSIAALKLSDGLIKPFSYDQTLSEALAICPNLTTIVSAALETPKIIVWGFPNGKILKTLDKHKLTVTCLSFHPSGQQLASGSRDKTIIIWNTRSWESLKVISADMGIMVRIAYSPDGCYMASGSTDCSIKVWEIDSPACYQFLTDISQNEQSLSCSGTWVEECFISESDLMILSERGAKVKSQKGCMLY